MTTDGKQPMRVRVCELPTQEDPAGGYHTPFIFVLDRVPSHIVTEVRSETFTRLGAAGVLAFADEVELG